MIDDGAHAGDSSSERGDRRPVIWRQLVAETTLTVGERPAARWLCEVASGADRLDDVLDEPATQRMVAHLDAMLRRHAAGEPLAYVLGRWSFRHLDLAIDRRVLIPRPETEVVAGVAIELALAIPCPVEVADLGTGSGAIGLALADELPAEGVTVWLTDISADALDVARANLAGIGRRARNVRIVEGSWFDALADTTVLDVAVANPPYVSDSADVDRAVREWEPHGALFSGADGLDDVRAIAGAAPTRIRGGGWLVLEISADQGAVVHQLLTEQGYEDVSIRPDLAGRDRVAVGRVRRSASARGEQSARIPCSTRAGMSSPGLALG